MLTARIASAPSKAMPLTPNIRAPSSGPSAHTVARSATVRSAAAMRTMRAPKLSLAHALGAGVGIDADHRERPAVRVVAEELARLAGERS